MIFSDIRFLLFFAFVSIFFIWGSSQYKKIAILVVSYVFYSFWNWKFLSLIILSTVIDYWVGILLFKLKEDKYRKMLITVSVVQNLGLLCVFKYYNFFIESFAELLQIAGFSVHSLYTLNVILPVGISFYTFQTMSYTLDIYRKTMNPTKSFLDFANYVAFFPQLVAGPIERASHLIPQLEKFNGYTTKYWKEACGLILMGYIRKVLIADNIAPYVDRNFDNYANLGSAELVTTLILFSMQIYFDFSGYSNIARGIAKLFGIDLMVNFRQPYFSCNVSEFWHRWHISLSTWLRDYLYIPLGGNRKGETRTNVNLMTTMLLGGLWHGASWNFLIWGGLHGIYLVGYKWLAKYNHPLRGKAWFTIISIVFVYVLVLITWLPFRAANLKVFSVYLTNIVCWHGGFPLATVAILILMFSAFFIIDYPAYRTDDELCVLRTPLWIVVPMIVLCCLAILALMIANMNSARPFVYFQF